MLLQSKFSWNTYVVQKQISMKHTWCWNNPCGWNKKTMFIQNPMLLGNPCCWNFNAIGQSFLSNNPCCWTIHVVRKYNWSTNTCPWRCRLLKHPMMLNNQCGWTIQVVDKLILSTNTCCWRCMLLKQSMLLNNQCCWTNMLLQNSCCWQAKSTLLKNNAVQQSISFTIPYCCKIHAGENWMLLHNACCGQTHVVKTYVVHKSMLVKNHVCGLDCNAMILVLLNNCRVLCHC